MPTLSRSMKEQILGWICLVVCLSARASMACVTGPAFAVPLDFAVVESLDLDLHGVVNFNFLAGPALTTGEPGNS